VFRPLMKTHFDYTQRGPELNYRYEDFKIYQIKPFHREHEQQKFYGVRCVMFLKPLCEMIYHFIKQCHIQ
jgi:hypothetical protein